MEAKYREYLEEGTRKIIEIVSSPGVGEEEKGIVVDAFADELSNNIGNIGRLQDYEPLLYGVSIKFIDGKITSVLTNQNATYRDYENAVKLCQRQRDLVVMFRSRKWELPVLDNRNIDKCEEALRRSQESISISSRIMEEDRQIDDLIRSAQTDLSVRTCDAVIELVSKLEEGIALCKSEKVPLPVMNHKDTKSIRKQIAALRKVAEQKEALHQNIFDVDLRIYSAASLKSATPEQWQEIIELCQRQTELLLECTRNRWPLPSIRYGNPNETADRYKLYLDMISIDRMLSSERKSLASDKQYESFFANCERQKSNIEICSRNGWDIPALTVNDPTGMLNVVHGEKSKKERERVIKGYFIKTSIICLCIFALVIFCIYKYREGKVQIPFDPSYVSGEDLQDIYDELEEAGFERIWERPDDSGWLNSGEVIGVSIDNSRGYDKGDRRKSDVKVVITYSSEGRIFVTDLLKNWQTADYKSIQNTFKQAGFTNITVEEIVTSDKEKDKMTAALSLNRENYTNERCYLPLNAPIVISYYVLKIGIGNDSSQFRGQDYESVVNSLKESGFTNVQTQKITAGWERGNTVVGVAVNNVETYDSSELFDPDVKIVVKYSSNDRVDATSILKNWHTKDYEQMIAALKEKGFTNIAVVSKETDISSRNHLVASISLNNDSFIAGDCHIQSGASIKLEYYVFTIAIGDTASNFAGNQYSDIVAKLKNKGFTNIHLQRANNLINGWITKEGSIKSFTIDGSSDFADTDSFHYDVQIVIVVNTFRDKGCEDITDIVD